MTILLFSRTGQYIESATIPPFDPLPRRIRWQGRTFVHRENDEYQEGD